MIDNCGKFFVINNVVQSAATLELVNVPESNVVYEVIRVIRTVPLFWEDHYSRMRGSLKSIGFELDLSQQEIKKQIKLVISENALLNCNVKLVVFIENQKLNLLMYISKSYYPSADEVNNGVPVGLLQLERENPNAKVIRSSYKETVARKIKEDQVFEVLLVNKDNKITEGSRSNVFFVKGNKAYTAPGEYVLKGITRQYIIDACKRLGFEVFITLIGTELLKDMDGIFISGTSNKVLPVSEVDGMSFKSGSNPTIAAIRDLFDHIIDDYVKNNIE